MNASSGIKYETHSRDAKAKPIEKSLNGIKAAHQVIILHKAQARQCFNNFKEFPEKHAL